LRCETGEVIIQIVSRRWSRPYRVGYTHPFEWTWRSTSSLVCLDSPFFRSRNRSRGGEDIEIRSGEQSRYPPCARCCRVVRENGLVNALFVLTLVRVLWFWVWGGWPAAFSFVLFALLRTQDQKVRR
jgi:hypothetical protein